MKNNGIVALNDYPYTGSKGTCKSDARKLEYKIKSTYSGTLSGDEEALKRALANFGPVVIYIQVVSSFYNYQKGIYWDQSCSANCHDINHAVVLVGYGTDKTSYKTPVDYWIIKNSWGTTWGDGGYVRMIKGWNGMKNNCNVACYIRYSVI